MDSNHHLQNRNLVCYHYTMEQYIVAPEGVEPSLTEPKPVVLPLYHRALSVEPRGVEPRSEDFQSSAYTKSAKVPGQVSRRQESNLLLASTDGLPFHITGSTMRPFSLSVCKITCTLCQFVGQAERFFIFLRFFFLYPLITATGSSLVFTFTRSTSLAMTSSMSLYAPEASCMSS